MNHYNHHYHKGIYRGHEWAKHVRPFLKRMGNKRWRKAAIPMALADESKEPLRNKKRPKSKTIKVKITFMYYGRKHSETKCYHNLRDVQNAINRALVIRYHFVSPTTS